MKIEENLRLTLGGIITRYLGTKRLMYANIDYNLRKTGECY